MTTALSDTDLSSAVRTVLVVDDAPMVTQALARLLEGQGYHAVPCLTAATALDWLEQNASELPPTAVLIDIHLPDGSGLDLARKVRETFGASVPVIVVSGDTSMDNLRALPDAGATLFLAKPVHVPTLLKTLKGCIDVG